MIKLNEIKKVYNVGKSNEFVALNDISLSVDNGELVAIIGKSGAGKSTLLHILACIDSFEDGEYYIDNKLIKKLNEKQSALIRNEMIGMIMQDFALVEDFTVEENVLLPLDFSHKRIKNKRDLVYSALNAVSMDSMSKKPCNSLSGGQKQRVAIARAIVNNPSLILADEPTGALDTKTSAEIMMLFKELHKQGKTIIIVTHDLNIAQQCNRIIEISDGRIISDSITNN